MEALMEANRRMKKQGDRFVTLAALPFESELFFGRIYSSAHCQPRTPCWRRLADRG